MKKEKFLIETANNYGYVVRDIQPAYANKFGSTDLVVIETGSYLISYTTNVLHGANYFKIHLVKNMDTGTMYYASRYHQKFVHLISTINGQTYLKLIREENGDLKHFETGLTSEELNNKYS